MYVFMIDQIRILTFDILRSLGHQSLSWTEKRALKEPLIQPR